MAENIEISEQQHQSEERDNTKCNIDDISDSCKYDVERERSFCSLQRYSRYDLLSLRNDHLSIHHPECAQRPDLQALSIWTCRLRCELQYLGLWKVPNAGNQYGNNASCCQSSTCTDAQSYASPGCGNVQGISGCYANVQQPLVTTGSSPTLGNKRAVRSRERFLNHQRCINTELIRATSPAEIFLHHSNHQNAKAAFIDHRSISSSHLMPAFAKRRMGNANSFQNSLEGGSLPNNGNKTDHLGNEGSDDGESPNQFDTSLKARKDTSKAGISQNDHYVYKTATQNNRMDKNDQLIDNQSGWMNLVQKINSESSNKTSGINKKLYERRIGSGRLVPRDVNWDVRAGGNGKQVDKNTPASSTGEKDNIGVGIEKLNQRNSTTRYSDPRPQERRPYERRISNSDTDTNREKPETNISGGNKRHSTNQGNERNNVDANSSNHYQQTPQHFIGQRSMSFRRREYAEHNRDHRDYRDFREQRDFREHREPREQKEHRDHRDEPEWFSEGPTSQHDTIELRGFEENDDTELDDVKHSTKIERKSTESLLSHNNSDDLSTNENSDVSIEVSINSNKVLLEMDNDNKCRVNDKQSMEIIDDIVNHKNILKTNDKTENMEKIESNVTELFFDNFLNMEALESTLIGGQDQTVSAKEGGGTSRFSQWFFNNSNNNICNNDEFNQPIIDELKSSKDESNCNETNSFMAFLKCNNFPAPELPKSLPLNVSALSVEELEARMRKMDTSDRTKCEHASDGQSKSCESTDSASQTPDIPSQDVEAFRKLLDQLGKPQVDISMNIILPQTGPLTTPMGVLPPGIASHTLPQSNMLKNEYMLKVMHQQQLLHHQPNLLKAVPPTQHHRLPQLSPQQQQQAGGGCENMPIMPVPHHPHLTSLVIGHPQKRLDVQHLMQSVVREELSHSFLEREMRNPNIPPYAKDIISTVLKETSRGITSSAVATQNTLPAGGGPAIIDSNTSQHPGAADNAAPQNLMQSLARGEVSLNLLEHELNKLNIPTQRELQIHTHAIMQNALLKKKLEVEQHEAIRRRQEMHKQLELEASNQQQPPSRHMNSPTPLAFTPTSVLRKMTAEKDNSQQTTMTLTSPQLHQPPPQSHIKHTHQQFHNQQLSLQHVNQPRMILGGGNHQHLHQQQHQVTTSTNGSPQISPQQKAQIRNQPPAPMKWSSVPHSSMNATHPLINNINKPMGRPILKGPVPTITQHTQNQYQQGLNQSNQIQNSQPAQTLTQMQKYSTLQQPRQIVGQQFPSHLLPHQINTSHQNNMQHQQLFQQQQQQRSTAIHCQQIQHGDAGNNATIPPVHRPANNDNNSVTNINYQRDGGLSPTSNQLAQWFSPELLAQASAGKLPLLNMNQALSLEEFERSIQHSSTAVHN